MNILGYLPKPIPPITYGNHTSDIRYAIAEYFLKKTRTYRWSPTNYTIFCGSNIKGELRKLDGYLLRSTRFDGFEKIKMIGDMTEQELDEYIEVL